MENHSLIKRKFFILVLSLLALTQFKSVNACLSYDQTTLRCSVCRCGTHLYKGNCLYDLPNCLDYHQGVDCRKCSKGFKLVNRIDRIECAKLQIEQNEQQVSQQIDRSILEDQTQELRQHFYSFLNQYLIQKYQQHKLDCQLVKVIDKLYKNQQRQAIMIYKTSQGTVQKTIVEIFGNYNSFKLKQTLFTQPEDITQDQIVVFENEVFCGKTCPSNSQIKDVQNQQSTPSEKTSSQKAQTNNKQIKQTSDFNYKYQKPESRQKDIGFQRSDDFMRLNNIKILNDDAKVVGCYVKISGMRRNYRIFYKTHSGDIYEGEVIYDIQRMKAYILNFGKHFSA